MNHTTQEGPGAANTQACPWCGTENQARGFPCSNCGRYLSRAPQWGRKPQGGHRLFPGLARLGAGALVLLLGLAVWWNRPFFPNPIVLLFRGPTTGVTSDFRPGQWPMSGKDLQQTRYAPDALTTLRGRTAWSVGLGPPSQSTPVVADSVIYIGGDRKLLALDEQSGRTIWELETEAPVNHSPAVAGDTLYVGLQDLRLLALDRATAETLWEFPLDGLVSGSPAVASGIVYIGSERNLYALDAANGQLIWKRTVGKPIHSPPAIHDGKLFAASSDGSLYSLDASTGRQRLRFRTAGPVIGAPVAASGLVYFVAGGKLHAIDAGAREIPGQFYLKRVWLQFWLWGFPLPPPPAQPGSKWRFSSPVIVSSPAAAPNALYVGDTRGNFYAVDPLRGTEIWQFQAEGGISGSPSIAGGQVYFGDSAGNLYALDRSNGQAIWQLSLGSPIEASPVLAGERLYVRTGDGQLYAVE